MVTNCNLYSGMPSWVLVDQSSCLQAPSGPALVAQPGSFAGHSQSVYGVVHDAANQQIISCSQDGSAVLWTEDGHELHRYRLSPPCLLLSQIIPNYVQIFPQICLYSQFIPNVVNESQLYLWHMHDAAALQIFGCRRYGSAMLRTELVIGFRAKSCPSASTFTPC